MCPGTIADVDSGNIILSIVLFGGAVLATAAYGNECDWIALGAGTLASIAAAILFTAVLALSPKWRKDVVAWAEKGPSPIVWVYLAFALMVMIPGQIVASQVCHIY